MLFSCFYGVQGFEPSIRNLQEKFKADLKEMILNLPFLISYKKVTVTINYDFDSFFLVFLSYDVTVQYLLQKGH